MKLGVFIPIGNNGWLLSEHAARSTSRASRSTARGRGEGGGVRPGLRAVDDQAARLRRPVRVLGPQPGVVHPHGGPRRGDDQRIELFATCARRWRCRRPLAARMAVDDRFSIAGGRFGVNLISGWQRAGVRADGPVARGRRVLRRALRVPCSEYVTGAARAVVAAASSDFKGDFSSRWTTAACAAAAVSARHAGDLRRPERRGHGASPPPHADYNFCAGFGCEPRPRRWRPAAPAIGGRRGRDRPALSATLTCSS